ncbi:hypothetical protein DL93DRAFT_1780362 [Clavulina sp. PMI_390]|nr:hypothetical protein DL93DRAFT_1780362 [Clavulina sp. PMI_390]
MGQTCGDFLEGTAIASQVSHRHPSLLPLLGIIWRDGMFGKEMYTVHPFIPAIHRGFPFRKPSVIDDQPKFPLMLRIAEAVRFLHENNIVHSDVHWATIIFSDWSAEIRLWNYGCNRFHHHRVSDPWIHHMEPLLDDGITRFPKHGDVFSCGMMFLGLAIMSIPAHLHKGNRGMLFRDIALQVEVHAIDSQEGRSGRPLPQSDEIGLRCVPQYRRFWQLSMKLFIPHDEKLAHHVLSKSSTK